jgi:hypothetical protein
MKQGHKVNREVRLGQTKIGLEQLNCIVPQSPLTNSTWSIAEALSLRF